MNKVSIKKTFLAIITTAIVIFPVYKLLNKPGFSDSFQCETSNVPIPLLGKSVSQTFFPNKDGLFIITVYPVTYERNFGNGIVHFIIKDTAGKKLHEQQKSIFLLEDNMPYEIFVSPTLLKKATMYTLEISYSKAPQMPIGFWTTGRNCYEGTLSNGTMQMEDNLLITQKYSNQHMRENFKELTNRISQYKPLWFKGDTIIYLLAMYIFFTVIFLILIIKKIF